MRYRELNTPGYYYLAKGQTNEAVAVFILNTEAHPASGSVYDSLGEAYMNAGERQLAIENRRRSLELNPDDGQRRFHAPGPGEGEMI